jgi:hypothetical protein
VPMWRFGDEALAFHRAATHARHVGLGPGLIDEDEPLGIELALMALPALTLACNVGPILLAGVQRFF